MRHTGHSFPALTALALVALAAGCGGGSSGGGEGSGDLAAEAADVQRMLDQLQSLPKTATTQQEFSQQLSQISTQLQTEIEEVPDADADSDELTRERDQLGDRLRSLRTNLNRIQHQVDAGDLDSAKAAIPRLLAIGEIEQSVEKIRSTSGGGSG